MPKGTDDEADINPFTKDERDLIIETFKSNSYYSYYTSYIQFLFFTGCRPCEAIALQWKHIKSKAIQFRQSVVISEEGLVCKEGLKTQKKRDFPINDELQIILAGFNLSQINMEAYVFPSPKGKFINQGNFSSRAWKSILEQCNIPYRKCYQTRHTFITMCVEANYNSTLIGRWTGTSAKMIDKHYGATKFQNVEPPNLM